MNTPSTEHDWRTVATRAQLARLAHNEPTKAHAVLMEYDAADDRWTIADHTWNSNPYRAIAELGEGYAHDIDERNAAVVIVAGGWAAPLTDDDPAQDPPSRRADGVRILATIYTDAHHAHRDETIGLIEPESPNAPLPNGSHSVAETATGDAGPLHRALVAQFYACTTKAQP